MIEFRVKDYYGNPSYYSVMPQEIFNANETALIENTTALINEVAEMRKLVAEQIRNNQDQFCKFMELLSNLTHK